jgi:thiol-disulfide isomerase/thioredoxin
MRAQEVECDHVPRLRESILVAELDGDLVVLERDAWQVHVISGTGRLIFECLDGSAPVSELAADLAEGFGAPLEQVRTDVLAFVRSLGELDLLERVVPTRPSPTARRGVRSGYELEHFEMSTLAGDRWSRDDLLGGRTLLVNWNPDCSYCDKIAPDLAAAHHRLEEAGVGLVLVSSGDAARNAALVAEHGLRGTVLLREEGAQLPAFRGLGTPASYVIDETGHTVGAIAYGAGDVLAMLRSAFARPR